MYCHKCGTQLLDDSEYCFKCGTRVSALAVPETVATVEHKQNVFLRFLSDWKPYCAIAFFILIIGADLLVFQSTDAVEMLTHYEVDYRGTRTYDYIIDNCRNGIFYTSCMVLAPATFWLPLLILIHWLFKKKVFVILSIIAIVWNVPWIVYRFVFLLKHAIDGDCIVPWVLYAIALLIFAGMVRWVFKTARDNNIHLNFSPLKRIGIFVAKNLLLIADVSVLLLTNIILFSRIGGRDLDASSGSFAYSSKVLATMLVCMPLSFAYPVLAPVKWVWGRFAYAILAWVIYVIMILTSIICVVIAVELIITEQYDDFLTKVILFGAVFDVVFCCHRIRDIKTPRKEGCIK